MRETTAGPPVPMQPGLDDIGRSAIDIRRGDLAEMVDRIGDRPGDPVAGPHTPEPDDIPRAVGLGNEANTFVHVIPQVTRLGDDTNWGNF